MTAQRAGTQPKIVILIANGFEEAAVAACLSALRAAGMAVSLVGTSAGLINSTHGLPVLPDYSLDRLPPDVPPGMIVVPGAPQCTALLLADPRAHQLISDAMRRGDYVAVFQTAEAGLERSGLPATGPHRYVAQGARSTHDFVAQLVHLAAGGRH